MKNTLRLLVTMLFISASVIGCGDQDSSSATEENTATPAAEMAMASEKAADIEITAGMTKEEVMAKLGEPTYSETRNLDALAITHSEWTNDKGTTSVQFHNDVVAFNQFVAAPTE